MKKIKSKGYQCFNIPNTDEGKAVLNGVSEENYQKEFGGSDKDIEQIYESWNAEWNGDLELVQTHEIYR